MIRREELLEAIIEECTIIKHLYTKLPPASLDYRPSPQQRSTLELLQYLSTAAIASLQVIVQDDWRAYDAYDRRSERMRAEEFPAAMDGQIEEIVAVFASLSDRDLHERTAPVPGGRRLRLGAAILNMTMRWLTAYRMQLFLYAKAAGATAIGTQACWTGTDPSSQPRVATEPQV